MYQNELYHHGIKGMKWGVRKQKSSSSSSGTKSTSRKKKVAVAAAATLTVAAAATLYGKNPKVRKAVNSALAKAGKTSMKVMKDAANSAKEGVKEGIKEAPKKAAKAIVIGIGMNAAKRMLDQAVGKEEAARIFKANNNKKIDSFWKVSQEDKDDD